MKYQIIALAAADIITVWIPLIALIVILVKNRKDIKRCLLLTVIGALFYIAGQYGIKEHVLSFLFSKHHLMDFMNAHYLIYHLLVSISGVILIYVPLYLVVRFAFKNKMTISECACASLGYSITESLFLVAVKSVMTIFEIVKDKEEVTLRTSNTELWLSGYERLIITIITLGIFAGFVCLMEKKMSAIAFVEALIAHTLVVFLPGFFIAFSTTDFLEVYSRNTALILTYVVLTPMAIIALLIINAIKSGFYTEKKK